VSTDHHGDHVVSWRGATLVASGFAVALALGALILVLDVAGSSWPQRSPDPVASGSTGAGPTGTGATTAAPPSGPAEPDAAPAPVGTGAGSTAPVVGGPVGGPAGDPATSAPDGGGRSVRPPGDAWADGAAPILVVVTAPTGPAPAAPGPSDAGDPPPAAGTAPAPAAAAPAPDDGELAAPAPTAPPADDAPPAGGPDAPPGLLRQGIVTEALADVVEGTGLGPLVREVVRGHGHDAAPDDAGS
jgi:hypothetical protein